MTSVGIEMRVNQARRFANKQNVREPELWQERIGELVSLINQDSRSIPHLIQLCLDYNNQAKAGYQEINSLMNADGDRLDRPPIPLLNELAEAAHLAIAAFGPLATPYLLEEIAQKPHSSPERIRLFFLLADTGDPSIESIFASLNEKQLLESVQAEYRILTSWINSSPTISVQEEEEYVDNEVANLIVTLRDQYEQACRSKT